MKITFEEDGSFLEILPAEDKLTLVLCAKKSYKESIMSSVDLSPEQISKLISFLSDWKKEKE